MHGRGSSTKVLTSNVMAAITQNINFSSTIRSRMSFYSVSNVIFLSVFGYTDVKWIPNFASTDILI